MPKYVEKGTQKITEKDVTKTQNVDQPDEKSKPSNKELTDHRKQEAQTRKSKYVEKGSTVKQERATIDRQEEVAHKEPTNKNNLTKKYDSSSRNKRSKFNWNPSKITLDTLIPDMPKEVLKKPDSEVLDRKIKELDSRILQLERELKDKKSAKQRQIQAAKEQKTTFSKLSSANLSQLHELQGKMRKHIVNFQDSVKSQRKMIDKIKELRDQERNFNSNSRLDYLSKNELKQKRNQLENMLITKELSAKDRKKVQDQINECSRHQINARQDYELDLEHVKISDLIKIEQQQLNKLNADITSIRVEMDKLDQKIKKIEAINNSGQKNVQRVRSREEIEEEYERQSQRILDEIYRLQDEITSAKDTDYYDLEDYRDQQQLMDWIKMAEDEKRIIKQENEKYEKLEKQRKIEQEKRKKEREKELQQKQRRKEEYEKKKKEREEREKKYQQQLDKKLNSMPFDEQKKLCAFLKEYCQKLKPMQDNQSAEQAKEKREVELKGQWEKETKKGAKLIRNKREQEQVNELDITVGKKDKKQEKKIDKKVNIEDVPFDHTIHIIRLFENIHLLPPVKVENIDQTIEAIDKKLEYYENPSEQDIKKHRQKVANERNQSGHQQQGQVRRQVEKEKRPERKVPQLAEGDFPTL